MGQLNEAQTQRSVIEPILFNVLRWDVTDHTRVHVEKALEGEISTNFVDYALDHDGDRKFEILIEAKHLNSPLMEKEAQQLLRYMDLSKAQLGILTNGATWLFFDRESDAASPILDFDIAELNADDELRKAFNFLSYDEWNLDSFIGWAKSNGHLREIEGLVKKEIFENPSDELIEFFLRKARPNGPLSKRSLVKARDAFKRVVMEQTGSAPFED